MQQDWQWKLSHVVVAGNPVPDQELIEPASHTTISLSTQKVRHYDHVLIPALLTDSLP